MFQVSSQLTIPPPIPIIPAKKLGFDLVSPEIRKRQTFTVGDALSDLSTGLLASVGLLILSIPLMNKHAERLAPFLAKRAERLLHLKLTPQQRGVLQHNLANRKQLEERIKQIMMGAIFLIGVTNYQTSYNSRQPSLLFSTLIRDAASFIGMFFPNPGTFMAYLMGGILFDAGKCNDIANNNSPLFRREWDLKRLSPHHSSRFLKELASSLHFILDDFRHLYQLKHWKSLWNDLHNKNAWKTPQPYQLGLAAQIGTLSGVLASIGLLRKQNRLRQAAGVLLGVCELLVAIPLMNRARRQKKELDGAMVLAGFPMLILGCCFSPLFSSSLFFMEGFEVFGGAVGLKGLNLNSKRFKSLREEIEWLAIQSKHNPELTAADILKELDKPSKTSAKLTQRLGKSRMMELKQLLRQAEGASKKGITLQIFLAPSLHAEGDAHHKHGSAVSFIG